MSAAKKQAAVQAATRREQLANERRLEQSGRPKYSAANLPPITPLLKKLGLKAWCVESEPDRDCTGFTRLTRGNCRFILEDYPDINWTVCVYDPAKEE